MFLLNLAHSIDDFVFFQDKFRSFGDHSNTRALKTLANAWNLTGTELGKLKTVELSGVDFTSFLTWKQFCDGDPKAQVKKDLQRKHFLHMSWFLHVIPRGPLSLRRLSIMKLK